VIVIYLLILDTCQRVGVRDAAAVIVRVRRVPSTNPTHSLEAPRIAGQFVDYLREDKERPVDGTTLLESLSGCAGVCLSL